MLLHEVGHVLRDHGGRGDAVASPMWNVAADAEINDDLIAAGLGLPDGVVTPTGIGCEDGHAAEVYYRQLVPPGAPRSDSGRDDEGCGCGSGAGDAPVPGELPATADLGSGTGLSTAAADLVKIAVARAVQSERRGVRHDACGHRSAGSAPARPAVVPWPKMFACGGAPRRRGSGGAGSSLLAQAEPARTGRAAVADAAGAQDRRRSAHRHIGVDG